eukprot:gb/GECG01012620.1/.p1 GENE.gb/GECG01012620.1/~~gb/GECG01012620.1/.p1  ORF type:complete len:512 (+),score=47.69 gb/GECG01012620.1/:1-1536(+)
MGNSWLCQVNPLSNDMLPYHVGATDAEKSRYEQQQLKKAALHAAHSRSPRGSAYEGEEDTESPIEMEGTTLLCTRFKKDEIEDAFQEWKLFRDGSLNVFGIIAFQLTGLYLVLREFVEDARNDHVFYYYGSFGMLSVIAFPALVVLANRAPKTQHRTKLFLMCLLVTLYFAGGLKERRYEVYVRHMNLGSIYFKMIVSLVSSFPSHYYFCFNAFDSLLQLGCHYFIRQFSSMHIFQWTLIISTAMQLQSYMENKREREKFLRYLTSWMETRAAEKLKEVHDFVSCYSSEAIALHRRDPYGVLRFSYISCSMANLAGWSEEDLLRKPVKDFVDPRDQYLVDYIRACTYREKEPSMESTCEGSKTSYTTVASQYESTFESDAEAVCHPFPRFRHEGHSSPDEEWKHAVSWHRRYSGVIGPLRSALFPEYRVWEKAGKELSASSSPTRIRFISKEGVILGFDCSFREVTAGIVAICTSHRLFSLLFVLWLMVTFFLSSRSTGIMMTIEKVTAII